ncbi:hypothetical protein QEH52_02330 [Coraliomargarita sp. SDUM461003]|uniref:PA14 domain-containing protein n=1 Tax=Thalassobacterium maritimum TaxID=3041265 RepID=A0ABU1AQK9_9BACT|nr:hypothetical protein [Coraliomargarita sp. SDUM461003]MDQ8206328.1 hypothetical protein [Coraliomargarita sp. SDUM461003]
MISSIQKSPLLAAALIALVLCAAVSLALYFNEDWRQTSFALIKEVVNEDGEVVRQVEVERPEPNLEQVREIANNQELKKREKLKENAKKLRQTITELQEVVETRQASLAAPDAWDDLAIRAGDLLGKAESLRFWTTKHHFLRAQPGVTQQLTELRNLTKKNLDQMRMLALQEEVDKTEAWEVLDTTHEMVDALPHTQALIRTAYQTASALPADQDRAKTVEYMTDRVERVKVIIAEAESYLKDFEKLLMTAEPVVEQSAELLPEANQAANTSLPNEAPAATTDTTETTETTIPSEAAFEAMNSAELYASIQEMTEHLDEAFGENKALELAEFKRISLEEAKQQVYAPTTDKGPDLVEQLDKNKPDTREEFKSFNEALDQAVRSSERITRQAENRLDSISGTQVNEDEPTHTAEQLKAALKQDVSLKAQMAIAGSNMGRSNGNMQDLRSLMDQSYLNSNKGGTVSGTGNDRLDHEYDSDSFQQTESNTESSKGFKFNWNTAIAQALPGRSFDMDSSRKGWIFIDTWYMIGPWALPTGREFEVPFPPETMVDLDATYEGRIHPSTKKPMRLKWNFVQSGSLRIRPPDDLSSSVFFAYTEVFCANTTDVVVAIASDDRAKLWINDLVVFEDVGLSPWRLDEGFRRVLLKPGYNKLLLRLENGPGASLFSVLMCPAGSLSSQ